MQIALFGGSFDPVHNGHILIAQEVLKAVKSVDEVWLVPDAQHHWKSAGADIEDRLAMLKLVEEPKIKISEIGIQVAQKRNGMTVTIDVIRELQKKTTNTYIFIAGSDQLPRLHEWHDYKELMMRLPFLIFPRVGYQLEGDLPEGCMWLSDKAFEPLDDSSTKIRENVKMGKSISGLVPKVVEKYIVEHQLYKLT